MGRNKKWLLWWYRIQCVYWCVETEYDDNEEGTVIAKVNYKTKEVEYLDNDAKTDAYAQEIINETLKQIDDGDFENCD